MPCVPAPYFRTSSEPERSRRTAWCRPSPVSLAGVGRAGSCTCCGSGTSSSSSAASSLARELGQILQQFNLEIEVDDACLVLALVAQHVVKEGVAGGTFFVEQAPLAQAGVHQQPEGERVIGVTREVLDGLRTTVFFQLEIVFAEIADHGAVLVANRSEQIDDLHIGRESGGVLDLSGVFVWCGVEVRLDFETGRLRGTGPQR